MPAPALLEIFARSNITTSPGPPVLQVVCAFPVSGQYGPGSRILYYVLVCVSIFARKAEWLRDACLAAALIFPAVAAMHGIVLASLHVNGAVDMDVYGAFQLCAIAILAAPLTVRLSRTYFYVPGRNMIFLWTVLILSGLIALCVEFYRATPTRCERDDDGNHIGLSAGKFPYGNATCGLVCSESKGPFSPMRGGAASNIYVIPVPQQLTFNTGMLLAAGLCIPAILSLIFTWDKILEINWKRRRPEENLDEPVEGATVTTGELRGINEMVRAFLNVIEVPVFGSAVLAIVGVGEANFFSSQVKYQTEPMASIGQWAPVAGTVLAGVGSLYVMLTNDSPSKQSPEMQYAPSTSNHSHHEANGDLPPFLGRGSSNYRSSSRSVSPNALGLRSTSPNLPPLVPTITEPDMHAPYTLHPHRAHTSSHVSSASPAPSAGRHRVRAWLTYAADHLSNTAHAKLSTSDYPDTRAHRFPEVPGENLRNPALERISTRYSVLREQNSRAPSAYAVSIASDAGGGGGWGSDVASPPLGTVASESASVDRGGAEEIGGGGGSGGSKEAPGSPRPDRKTNLAQSQPARRNTLEVPAQAHVHRRSESH